VKKLFLVMLALMLAPAMAIAGMAGISDSELSQVQGQTGITLEMSLSVSIDAAGWGDDDGFGATYTDPGWVVLDGVTLPTIRFGGGFDAGTDPGTGHSALFWTTMGVNLVEGDLTIDAIRIQDDYAAAGDSLGEIQIPGVAINFANIANPFGVISISAH